MSRATRIKQQHKKRHQDNTFFYRFASDSKAEMERGEVIDKTLELLNNEKEGFASAFIANMGITFVGIPKEAALILIEIYAKNALPEKDAEELIANIRQSNTVVLSLQKVVPGGQ